MNTMFTAIIVVQVVSALAVIALVLLQHGKGADMGAAFGSGASGSLFGASGSSNFLSRFTGITAAIFFGATLALAYLGNRPVADGGVMERLPMSSVPAAESGSAESIPSSSNVPATGTEKAPGAGASGQSSQIPK